MKETQRRIRNGKYQAIPVSRDEEVSESTLAKVDVIRDTEMDAGSKDELPEEKIVPFPTEWEKAKKGMFFTALDADDDVNREEENK